MSTLTVAEITLDREGSARRVRRIAAAVRVGLRWWGVHRSLNTQQKEEVSAGYAADARFPTAGKKILDARHEAFRRLTSLKTQLGNKWRGATPPYTEAGVRLIRQSDVESFVHTIKGFRDDLTQAEEALNAVYEEIQADARRRLGGLYDPRDYPAEASGLFGVEWAFPSVEPPSYLLRIAPGVYEQERAGVAARFDEAVRLAEQALAAEFTPLPSHLSERLAGGPGGERRIFRDSAMGNLGEFFERYQKFNVRSNPELDALVERARRLVRGVAPGDLRRDDGLRRRVAEEMGRVRVLAESLLVDAPRRRIVRPEASVHGGGHATAS